MASDLPHLQHNCFARLFDEVGGFIGFGTFVVVTFSHHQKLMQVNPVTCSLFVEDPLVETSGVVLLEVRHRFFGVLLLEGDF